MDIKERQTNQSRSFKNVSKLRPSLIERLFESKILRKYFVHFGRRLSRSSLVMAQRLSEFNPPPHCLAGGHASWAFRTKRLGKFFPVLNRLPNGALELVPTSVSGSAGSAQNFVMQLDFDR